VATDDPIPVLDLQPEIESLRPDLLAAVEVVFASGRFILGPAVDAFEREVADYLGVAQTVGLNSGTDALVISLRALGIGEDDEVITTAFTFFATAEAISTVGAIPVFVDIDPASFNLDSQQVEAAITSRTAAIVPVHLFGHAASMDELITVAERHGLAVVEDAAQAFGGEWRERKLGTLGAAGAFSFFPTKNLGGFGDGGLIATNDERVATRARALRAHGSLRKHHNETLGHNSRLDELQAALLRVKLPHLDAANAGRRRVAARYRELLNATPGVLTPTTAEHVTHVFHQYTVRIARGRDRAADRLRRAGVGTMVYYPVPVHHLPVYDRRDLHLPEAEGAAAEVLSLPIWPSMADQTIERVASALVHAVE
jgi:dTDP-4-amino-4,6-dideoxygalactose transaminase